MGRRLIKGVFGFGAFVMVGVVTIFSVVAYRACKYIGSKAESVHATVNRVYETTDNGTTVHMVGTDKEVFMNADDPFRSKYNSSDVQNGLKPGCTYDFNVVGERNPAMSMFRNVITATHAADCKNAAGHLKP